jgi:hypothetical protein
VQANPNSAARTGDYIRSQQSGGPFLQHDSLVTMKKIISAAAKTIRPMVSVSQSHANEAGNAVLRSCCVELFVASCNALELLPIEKNALSKLAAD